MRGSDDRRELVEGAFELHVEKVPSARKECYVRAVRATH